MTDEAPILAVWVVASVRQSDHGRVVEFTYPKPILAKDAAFNGCLAAWDQERPVARPQTD